MPPRVESYGFGRMKVDGVEHTGDLILLPDGVRSGWWRKEGHRLHLEDLAEVLEADVEVLVVGTGYWGRMVVPEEVRRALEERGIRVVAEETGRAWRTYNRLVDEGRKVAGAFHLTC